MRRTSGQIELEVISRFLIGAIRYNFIKSIDTDCTNKEFSITSEESTPDDDECMFLNISSLSLRLDYKEESSIDIYAIIEHFPDAKVKKHQARILSFADTDEFIRETENVKEMGDLIGNIIYNLLSDPVQSLLESGISMKPYEN